MKNKLVLAIGLLGTVSLSGCSVLNSMLTTPDEFVDKASTALDIPVEDLQLIPDTLHPGITDVNYQLTDKEGNTYKCTVKGSISSATPARCQKKVGNDWENVGKQIAETEDEKGGAWFNFSFGGSDTEGKGAPSRGVDANARSTPQIVNTETVPASRMDGTPTILFTPEDESVAFKTNPTKTYNGRFKVRDEQGHSYECHFANVGQVVSDTVSVCTKLY